MEELSLEICHYESHIHLGVLHKANVKSEKRTQFWTHRRAAKPDFHSRISFATGEISVSEKCSDIVYRISEP